MINYFRQDRTSSIPGGRAKDSFKMSIQPPISLFRDLEF
jgi:hypothetical protein